MMLMRIKDHFRRKKFLLWAFYSCNECGEIFIDYVLGDLHTIYHMAAHVMTHQLEREYKFIVSNPKDRNT